MLDEWELTVDGPLLARLLLAGRSRCAPTDGTPAVLKVALPGDDESEHEHLALQHWHGNGAVRLLRADPHRRALLLERLHREDLTGLWDLEACEIVAGLYPRLHVPALPQLRTVTSYVDRWLDRARRAARATRRSRGGWSSRRCPSGRDFVADPASTGVIVHGDLHYENVLAGDREPWLVIDPKPMSGDPHYELAPMLWNRLEELRTATCATACAAGSTPSSTPPGSTRTAPATGSSSGWCTTRTGRSRTPSAPTGRSTPRSGTGSRSCIAIAKAVQD